MFIYEKNKRNSETGKLEQTLNITFEGNKPVDNPDVVINKDGIEGIKSGSNSYYVTIANESEVSTYVSSFSRDDKIVTTPLDTTYFMITFNRYLSWNTIEFEGGKSNPQVKILGYRDGNFINEELSTLHTAAQHVGVGEFILDMQNLTLTPPNGIVYDFSDYIIHESSIKKEDIVGIAIGTTG